MLLRLPSRMTSVFGETLLAVVWSAVPLVGGLSSLYWASRLQGALLLALAVLLFWMALSPTRVLVGADGIAIRWMGFTRFVPYGQIASITPYTRTRQKPGSSVVQFVSRGVMITRTDGRLTYLVCERDAVMRDLLAFGAQGLERHQRAATSDVPGLRRSGRPVSEWLASLRGLLAAGGYRGGATSADDLWSIIENPRSAPADRAAAAVAVRVYLGDEARPRLRVATETCASPRLRVAFEAIDAEDEPKTTQAMLRL